MKSATSVESDHWMGWPRGVLLRNEMAGVSGAREARMSLLTWDRGWDGCRRNTVGGGRFVSDVGLSPFLVRVCPSGRMSLNKWDAVGESLPIGTVRCQWLLVDKSYTYAPLPSVIVSISSLLPSAPSPGFLSAAPFFQVSFLDASARNLECPTFVFSTS